MAFVPNVFEASDEIKFLVQGTRETLFLSRGGLEVAFRPGRDKEPSQRRLSFGFADGSRAAAPEGERPLAGKANFFIGPDPVRWRTDVPMFGAVLYREVYPGIDVAYLGDEGGRVKREFRVRPGADPRRIGMVYTGATGLTIEKDGTLSVASPQGSVRESPPLAYQEEAGRRTNVSCTYTLRGGGVISFEIGDFDPERVLIIDPHIVFNTKIGSESSGTGIGIDAAGNIYVGGDGHYGFPTTAGSYSQGKPMGRSGFFVSKFDSGGNNILYSTLISGLNSVSAAYDLAVDGSGNAFVTGYTNVSDVSKADFPIFKAYDATFGGEFDGFLLKLNPSGNALVFSTYLGGGDQDFGYGLALDSQGNAYVSGSTLSKDFPVTAGAYQKTLKGIGDAFLSKFGPGGQLLYSTLLGGDGCDKSFDLALDAAGEVYLTGWTNSKDFPTTAGSLQTVPPGGNNIFVTKFKPTGETALSYSTYFGGGGADYAEGIGVDDKGNVYLTGLTSSPDFPLKNAFDSLFGGGTCPPGIKGPCPLNADAFVSALDPEGKTLVYSTFLGGNGYGLGKRIAVEGSGSSYITGWTTSTDFPLKSPLSGGFSGNTDAFVAVVSAQGVLEFCTLLGSADYDYGAAIEVDGLGKSVITGTTRAADDPYGYSRSSFIVKTEHYLPSIKKKTNGSSWWPRNWWNDFRDRLKKK